MHDTSRFTKKCYDLAVGALCIAYDLVRPGVKTESKPKETMDPAYEIGRTTMRVERKECTTTRRYKAESGSSFKNWLITGSFEGATVTMRSRHATYNSLHVDVWYDFNVQHAKIARSHASYWIVSACENSHDTKIRMLEDVGIVAELAHLILEYSFPTMARISVRYRGRQLHSIPR